MKNSVMFLMSLICLINIAHADLSVCLRDAETHGHHVTPLSPLPECEGIIRDLPNKLEAVSSSGQMTAFGYQKMLYVNVNGTKELLAGDQTFLQNISFIKVDGSERKLIVYQKGINASAVSTYDIDFIGNVGPISHDVSADNNNLSNISILPDSEQLALVSNTDKKINFINQESDVRFKNDGPKWQRSIKRKIQGELTSLSNPSHVVESKTKNEIYVLDDERILVFGPNPQGNVAPIREIPAPGTHVATEMKLNATHSEIILHNNTQKIAQISLE